MDALRAVREFRATASACFTRRRDALCDLLDVMTAAGPRPSLAHLSLAAPYPRHWGSVYAALRHGRISVEALRELLVRYPLAASPPVYAVDVSVWPLCDAKTSKVPRPCHARHAATGDTTTSTAGNANCRAPTSVCEAPAPVGRTK